MWPQSWECDAANQAYLAGVALADIAAAYGTPVFIYDEQDFKNRARQFTQAFGAANVHYAGKSFLCGPIIPWLMDEGLSLDVCSGGELYIALKAGFPPHRIAMHGNNKSAAELEYALTQGVGHIVVDSEYEIALLGQLARENNIVQEVFIRLTTGIHAHTHEYISTAHEDQKFGFSIHSGAATAAVHAVMEQSHLRLVGFHSHIGSQIFSPDGFIQAADIILNFIARWKGTEVLEQVRFVDLGGGIGIAYTQSDTPLNIAQFAGELQSHVLKACQKSGIGPLIIQVEPGRAISGPAGITLYQVGTTKEVLTEDGSPRLYISVDGGMSDNIRPALYGAHYTPKLINRVFHGPGVSARIVGKHCETGDIIVHDCQLPSDVRPGDLLVVAATGAYCYAMSSRYNALPRPPVVAVRDGQHRLLLRKETWEDLVRLEVGNL